MIKRVALFLFVMINSLYATDDQITRGGGSFVGTQNQVFYKTITPSDLTVYPYEITTPGRYVVTRDFYHRALDAEKNGLPLIRITASNVTIDLQTFTLYQSPLDSEYKSDLISIEDGVNNIVIMNGTLAQANGFGIKITGGSSNIIITDVRITECSAGAIGIIGNSGADDFVYTTPSRNVLLQRVLCHNNARDNRAWIADSHEETPGVQYYIGDLVSALDDSQLFTVGAADLLAVNVYGLKIQDCSFSNTGVAQSLPVFGLYLDKCQYVSIQDTDVTLTRADGIVCGAYAENCSDVVLEKVHVGRSISDEGRAFGIILRSCQGVQCADLQTTLHAGRGVTGLWIWNSNGVTLHKTVIQNNTANGSLFVQDPAQNDPSYFPVYRFDQDSGLWEQNTNYSINLGSAYSMFNTRRLEIPKNSIDPEISDDQTFVYTKWQQLMNAYGALDVALDYWKAHHYAYGLRILNSDYVHAHDIQVIDTNAQYSSAWGILIDGGQGNMIQNALVQGTQGFSEFDPTQDATTAIQYLFESVLDEEGVLNDDQTLSMLSRAAAMEIRNCAQGTFVRDCVFKETSNAWGAGYGLFLNNSSKASVFDVKYEHNLGYDFGGGLVNKKYDPTDVVGGSTFFVNGWQNNFNHNWLLFWSDGGKFSAKHVYPGDLNLANNIGPYDNLVVIFDSVTQQTITCPADELAVNNYIVSLPVAQATFVPHYTDSGTDLSDFTFEMTGDITLSSTLTLQADEFSVSSETVVDYDDTGVLVVAGTGVLIDSSDDSEINVTFTGNIYVVIDEDGNLTIDTSSISSTLLIRDADSNVIAVLDVQEFIQTKMHAIFQLDYTIDYYNSQISLQFDSDAFVQTSGGYTLSNPSLSLNGSAPIILDFGGNYALAVMGTVDVTDADGNTTTCTVDYPTGILGLTVGENGIPFVTEGMFIHASLGDQSSLQYIVASEVHFIENISVDLNFNYNSTNTKLYLNIEPFTVLSGSINSEYFEDVHSIHLGTTQHPITRAVDYSNFDPEVGTRVYVGGTCIFDENTVYVGDADSYVYVNHLPSQVDGENGVITLYYDPNRTQKVLIMTIDDLEVQDTILGRLHFTYDGDDLGLYSQALQLNDITLVGWNLQIGLDIDDISDSIDYTSFAEDEGTFVRIGGTIIFEDESLGYVHPGQSYTYVTDTPSQGTISNGVLYIYDDSEYSSLRYIVTLGQNIFTNYVTAGFNYVYNQSNNTIRFDSPAFSIAGGQYSQEDFSDFELTLGIDPNPLENSTVYTDLGSATKVYVGGFFDLQDQTVYINGATSFTYLTDDPDNIDLYGQLEVFADQSFTDLVCIIDLVPSAFNQEYTFNFYWNNEGKIIFSYEHPVNGFEWAYLFLNGGDEIYVLSQGANEVEVTGTMFDAINNTLLHVTGTVYIYWSGIVGDQPTIDGVSRLYLYTDSHLEISYDPAIIIAGALTFEYDPNNDDSNNEKLYTFDDGTWVGNGDGTTYLGHMNFYYDETRLMPALDPITISVGGQYTQNDLSLFNILLGSSVNPTEQTIVYGTFDSTEGTKVYVGGTCMLDISGTPTQVYIGGQNSYVYVTNEPEQGLVINGILTVYSDEARTEYDEIFTVILGTSTFEQVIFGNVSFAYDDENLFFASPGLHITGGQFVQDDFTNYNLKLGTTAPAAHTSIAYEDLDAMNGTKIYLGGSVYVSLDDTPTKIYLDTMHSYVYVTNQPGQGAIRVGVLKFYADQTLTQHFCTMIVGESDFREILIP